MAETGTIISKQQSLASIIVQENAQYTSSFYNQCLYKAIIVSICILVIPYFPLQSPDFNNQTLWTTSWEFLQLIFVGIAVSYGLFSKRNDETAKDFHGSKIDNARSYVSGLLHFSSVFDDESESTSTTYENKVQTWNSQYYRGEPRMVILAPEDSVLDQEPSSTRLQEGERALFLPIRSMRSKFSDPEIFETSTEQSVEDFPLDRSSSSSGSRKISRSSGTINTEVGEGLSQVPPKLEEKVKENIVLRSPIPWKSRLGRLEMKDGSRLLPSSVEESITDKIEVCTFRSQSFRHSNSPPKNGSMSSFISMRSSTSSDQKDAVLHARNLERSVRSVPTKLSGHDNIDDLQTSAKTGKGADWWTRASGDGSVKYKYVESQETIEQVKGMVKCRGFVDDVLHVEEEKTAEDIETTFIKNRGYPDKIIHANPSFIDNQTFSDFPKEEKKNDFAEDDLAEMEDEDSDTDDDNDDSNQYSETDDDDEFDEILDFENHIVKHNSTTDGGPDVDKKADEFIARFREQIRLQRIASIRSTGQAQSNNTR